MLSQILVNFLLHLVALQRVRLVIFLSLLASQLPLKALVFSFRLVVLISLVVMSPLCLVRVKAVEGISI